MGFPPLIVLLSALLFALGIWIGWSRWYIRAKEQSPHITSDGEISRMYNDIEPLTGFDWKSTKPIQLRPFKPTYHLTMALQSCILSDLVAMDETYLERINFRRQIISTRRDDVVGCNPIAKDAVKELYSWIFGIYLPKRYPTMFSILPLEKSILKYLLNRVTDETIPLEPPADPIQALQTLGSHVDDEFLILIPSSDPNGTIPSRILPTQDPTTQYYLHAFTLCCPSGFNTRENFGLPLAAIHTSVPGYEAKIGKSMDRFFASVPFGKIVKRANWSVQTDSILFKLNGNHLTTKSLGSAPAIYEPQDGEAERWEKDGEAVKVEDCRVRCERQTLHRLEKTGALVFGFKTYLYELEKIKGEGSGEEMADAVEGLWRGSVPGMAVYKRGVIWGKKVVEFLREK